MHKNSTKAHSSIGGTLAPLSEPMPKLMTMLETSQAQDEITLLERQLHDLEAQMSCFTVGKTGQETPLLMCDVRPNQLLSDIPKGKQFGRGDKHPLQIVSLIDSLNCTQTSLKTEIQNII